MMRKIHFFLGYCSVCFTIPLAPVTAETTCSADVSYAWAQAITSSNAEGGLSDSAASAGDTTTPAATVAAATSPSAAKTGSPSPEPAVSPAAAGTAPPPTQAPTGTSASTAKPKVVIFARVERSGGSEDEAKAALGFEVERQRARAAERCKRAHESVGECVATKLSGRASTLNSLSFSARALAEKALIDECKIQEGRCLSVEVTTPTCRIKGGTVAQTPPPVAQAQPSVAVEEAAGGVAKPAEKGDSKKSESGKPAAKKK